MTGKNSTVGRKSGPQRYILPAAAFLTAVIFISGCSIQKMAINAVADALGGGTTGGSAFTTDDDPDLVGDALPFALKLYETLLEQAPEHTGLLLTTGMGFVMYSNAYVQSPADTLPEWEFEKQGEMYARAKNLYLRGRDYVFTGMELKYPGFYEAIERKNLEEFLQQVKPEDIDYLYWGAAGWFAAIAINVFDLELTIQIPQAKAMMDRAYELDPDYGEGTIDDFYILYYAALPPDLGGSDEKAYFHFERAVELSDGENASPYLSLATSMSIKNQDVEEFTTLLHRALEIDVDKNPETRMLNVIMQDKAAWFLEHTEDFFILGPDEEEEWE
jgi:predicted anti-sigma-YlaC factor YlaD